MVQHHCKCSRRSHPRARQRRNPFIPSDDSAYDGIQQWPSPAVPRPGPALRFAHNRQLGFERRRPGAVYGELLAEALPASLEEKEFNLGQVNKVFASQWLNDKQVVLGTKCNQLMVMDVMTGTRDHIPSLKSSPDSIPADCPCGIHSIAINPSRSLLATGALHTNDVAVYSLPSFHPVAVCEGAHDDWVFDMQWLDDEYLVTGSRDSRLALWQVTEHARPPAHPADAQSLPDHAHIQPRTVKLCQNAEKVRALVYNNHTWDVGAISLNAQLHIWDTETFTQKGSHRLRYSRENVCLALKPDLNLYAVGSQSHITFICPDMKKSLRTVYSSQPGNGIRSVSFREHILTFGTGAGSLFFYDIRACKYLECSCGSDRQLDVGLGWLKHDDTYRDFFSDDYYPNAIYTHCYDDSGTRLFAAGGPLPAGLWGNYSGLWQ